jgi:hypothetical protein
MMKLGKIYSLYPEKFRAYRFLELSKGPPKSSFRQAELNMRIVER